MSHKLRIIGDHASAEQRGKATIERHVREREILSNLGSVFFSFYFSLELGTAASTGFIGIITWTVLLGYYTGSSWGMHFSRMRWTNCSVRDHSWKQVSARPPYRSACSTCSCFRLFPRRPHASYSQHCPPLTLIAQHVNTAHIRLYLRCRCLSLCRFCWLSALHFLRFRCALFLCSWVLTNHFRRVSAFLFQFIIAC